MSKNRFRFLVVLALLVGLALLSAPKATKVAAEEGDPAVLAKMHEINNQLRSMGLNVAVEEIHLISFGQGGALPTEFIRQVFAGWLATPAASPMEITSLI